jgi:2-polyprenyl-3-methyl-5-hydroxy-6-metoxy-1,4-benzoquinol methylase
MSWHTDFFPFVMDTHVDATTYPEWGSAPHGPLIDCDMAHRGELMTSVVGESVTLPGQQVVYHVLRCELCIACHIWPLPDEAALAEYYKRRFYEGPAAHEVTQHERDRAWWQEAVYGPLFAQCETLLERKRLRLLDIGAGTGLALTTAKQRRWRAVGIEPSRAQAWSLLKKKYTVRSGPFDAQAAQCVQAYQPDVVLLWETLEHTVCPEDVLIRCAESMPPGALLVVSVPNDHNTYQIAACHKYHISPWWYCPPVHLWHFTPKTLQLLVRRCGFTIRDLRGTYPLEARMLEEGGQCYVGDERLWRQYTDDKIALELAAVRDGRWPELEAQYRSNLAQRIGRSIVCVAQRS